MTNIIDLTKRVRDFRDTYRGIDELGACDLLDEAAHVLHTLGADLYKAEGQRDALATKLDSANGCISDWVTFGAEVTEALGLKVMSPKDILREIERLRGLRPEIPERPPHNNDASHQHPALPRYGLRWNGPGEPVSVPMPDGYWTPFHLALEAVEQAPVHVPGDDDVEWPDVEDMAHSAAQEAYSSGINHDLFKRHMLSVMFMTAGAFRRALDPMNT